MRWRSQRSACCTSTVIHTNNAALSAAILYASYKQGIALHDTFLFAVDLENTGKWYRQLMGESIGKEYDRAVTVCRLHNANSIHW